jgi:cytochrome c-type biogenesis protein CcmH
MRAAIGPGVGATRPSSARWVALLCLAWGGIVAALAQPAGSEAQVEARVRAITQELRCLVCQNQTIADSHAALADDLRREVRNLVRQGASDQAVRDYMTQRYGDFVLYRPPVKASTWLLWAAPVVLLAAGGLTLVVSLRRRARLPDTHFEPDPLAPVSPGSET